MNQTNTNQKHDPFVLIIFGGTGDLARRKLVPALYNLCREGLLSEKFAVVGVSRSASSNEMIRQLHHESTTQFSRAKPIEEDIWNHLAQRISCVQGSVSEDETFETLKSHLHDIDQEYGTRGNRIFYFSTPSKVFLSILQNLDKSGMLSKTKAGNDEPWTRVIVEKPFGQDYETAAELNREALKVLNEDQIFRIDHYLGKETVQNILVFRFGNSIFEPLWNRKYIDHIQITAAEDMGIEGRGDFYDETGVFRDVVQNHLLEILTLCTMEAPITFRADDIRDQKLSILRSLQPLYEHTAYQNVIIGQYEGYLNEEGIPEDSITPTFAALKLFIDNWRWQGVPFYLRAGKKLKRRFTEVAIFYHTIPLCLFGRDDVCEMVDPNVLLLRIQPNEGISLRFVCKEPGDHLSIKNVCMDFDYSKGFAKPPAEAYERLILDCIRGDVALFARNDAIEHSWKFLDPVLNAAKNKRLTVFPYTPGSMGPSESGRLLMNDGRRWYE